MNAAAFGRNNPFGSKLNAIFSSDIGHFDVGAAVGHRISTSSKAPASPKKPPQAAPCSIYEGSSEKARPQRANTSLNSGNCRPRARG
jgi:hypothetical protein